MGMRHDIHKGERIIRHMPGEYSPAVNIGTSLFAVSEYEPSCMQRYARYHDHPYLLIFIKILRYEPAFFGRHRLI
jgi:hypothetical protein